MTLLAIDTASAFASVALFDGRTVLAEETWYARRHHDDHLFEAIERQLALAGLAVRDVTRVGVAVGPGSFTGVRVAIAAAQGMARASGAALFGASTADVAAWPFASVGSRVCVLIPAGRGEHYAAVYRRRRGAWTCVSPLAVTDLGGLARAIAMDTLFTGEIDDETESGLRERLGEGEGVAPERLEPLYLRAPLIRAAASRASRGS